MNKEEMIKKLQEAHDAAWWQWNKLSLPTFDPDYEEEYEDTVTRLYSEGMYDGLKIAIDLLKEGEK